MTSVEACGRLALDVIPLFIRACHAVSRSQSSRQPDEAFPKQLAAELFLVQQRLQDAASSGDMERLFVRKLLKNLERVYMVSRECLKSSPPLISRIQAIKIRYPLYQMRKPLTIVTKQFPSSLRSLETPYRMQTYPHLNELRRLNNIATLTKPLATLCSGTDRSRVTYRCTLLQMLSKFSKVDRKASSGELQDFLNEQPPDEESPVLKHDHSDAYRQIYQAHSQFCICQALSCENRVPVTAYVCLEGCGNSFISPRACGLSVVFPAHPHLVTERECQWQETLIFPAEK